MSDDADPITAPLEPFEPSTEADLGASPPYAAEDPGAGAPVEDPGAGVPVEAAGVGEIVGSAGISPDDVVDLGHGDAGSDAAFVGGGASAPPASSPIAPNSPTSPASPTSPTSPTQSDGHSAAFEPQVERELTQQMQQFSAEDPQAYTQIQQIAAEAARMEREDPQQASTIEAAATREGLLDIAHSDPRLAVQMASEIAQVDPQLAQQMGLSSSESPPSPAAAPSAQEIAQQEQQLAQQDPALAARIAQQQAQAEQAARANPQEEPQIAAQFEHEAIQEIGRVDPQLAQELAAQAQPGPHSTTSTHQTEPQHATPPAPVPSAQVIDQQVRQLAQQDPSLATEIRQQEAQAQQAAEKDPQQAAQIDAKLEHEEVHEIGQVDPRLAQELAAQAQQANVTFDAEGAPTQGVAPTDHVIGNPTQDASQWTYQGANGYCGPNSISMLIEAATGHRVTEQQIADYAIQHGEMTRLPSADDPSSIPSIHYGMLPQQAANAVNALAQQYGITAEIKTGNMGDLENYLKQGREVMIELDDQRIWHQPGVADSGSANHYVVVTGFDPSTNTVFINDPGVPDGKAESIPLSEFESAWSTSNDVMIVTDPSSSSGGGMAQERDARPGPVLLPIVMDGSLARSS